MTHSSTISSKGQVTVPQEIRVRLGLKTGDRVEFVVEGGNTLLRPARNAENPFEAYTGMLAGTFPGGIREINAWVDEMRREEEPNRQSNGRRKAVRRKKPHR
jgi:AbrB family looped-hinge helix DNA binding protein